jgi:hypothetical protein
MHLTLVHSAQIPRTYAGTDGCLQFIDGMTVARKLQSEQPGAFDMLKSVLVRFVSSENRQEQQVAAHKILTVDPDDESKVVKVCAGCADKRGRCQVTFNYAQRDTHMTISDMKVNRYYEALKQWHTLCMANTVDALVVKGG